MKLIKNNNLINYKKSQSQYQIYIEDVEIFFPYVPYPNQIEYMKQVIKSLKYKQKAALESPTGTGKTLCLLCASLAWINKQQQENKKQLRIIYSTRTHTQITNLISELRITCYEPNFSILSSRSQSCLMNSKINELSNNQLTLLCQKLFKKKACIYYKDVFNMPSINDLNIEYNKLIESNTTNKIIGDCKNFDIEELCKLGNSLDFCPY